MSLVTFIFYFFEMIAVVSALCLVLVRNVFYGALLLIVCLLSVAGIYILAFAEFVAVTQILIYAGGILVVILFGIMITSKISNKPLLVQHANVFAGVLAAGSFFVMLVYLLSQYNFTQASKVDANAIKGNPVNRIGIELMTDFMLPFEIAGVLLLIALIGAAVIASSPNSKKV